MPEAASAPVWSADEMRSFLKRNSLASPSHVPVLDSAAAADLDWGDAPFEQAHAAAMAHRRAFNLARDIDVGARLLGRGLNSAGQIAQIPADQFAGEHAHDLGIAHEDALAVHRRATRIQNRTLHLMAAVHGAVAQPHFNAMRVSNVGDALKEHFEDLPSYQEMFGSLDYCACDECKSIFGPAAYLVDLLRIVDECITTLNDASIPEKLKLNARRPDLQLIELTCEKTNTTFPYLRIVIERLMYEAEQQLGVHSPEEVLAKLATDLHYPLNLPFNAYLDRIRVLLAQVGRVYADVLLAWQADPAQVVREALGLSVEQLAIVETPVSDRAAIAAFYGIAAADLGDLAKLPVFMEHTGLTVPDVEDVVEQHVPDDEIAAGVPQNLFVNQGAGANFLRLTTNAAGATTITHLDDGALERINRLRRLAEAAGWTPSLTDWLLRAVKNGATPVIDAGALAGLLRVERLAARFGLTPLQAATFVGPLKTYGLDGDAGASFFDQLFNGSGSGSVAYHPKGDPLNPLYQTDPLKWAPGDSTTLEALMRVLPAFGLSVDAMTALGSALFGTTKTELTVEALSALYRHALLSRCLNLSMDQYLLLLSLTDMAGRKVFGGSDLDLLISRWDWLTTSGLDVYALAYITRAQESVFVDPLLDESRVADWLIGLVGSIDPKSDDAATQLDAQTASFLGIAQAIETAARPIAATAAKPPSNMTWLEAFLAPLDADGKPPQLQYAKDVLRWIARWAVFAQAAGVPAPVIACAYRNPQTFGLPDDYTALSPAAVRDLQLFAAMIAQYGDRRGDLIAYVDGSEHAEPPADVLGHLHAATGWSIDQVKDLLEHEVANVRNVVDRLRRLGTCLGQAAAIGADVSFMRGLAALAPLAASDSRYRSEAELLLQKVSAFYGPTGWAAISGEVHGKLQEHERDAVMGVVLAGLHGDYPDIRTPNNVYEFLLTDVETGPEAQISYVKEALNAVQLYLQRCRLRLEPGVKKIGIHESWWDWILNYRKWEANRRIFVYPENYLLPAIRQDQTAPFRQLASDLLQSEITAEYVEKAYDTYLNTLLSETQLVLVDAFAGQVHDEKRGGPADAIYIFARTATSPYSFYLCRRLEGGPWSEWEAIDLTINSTEVTPVYAFDKLFLFWVQLDELQSPAVKLAGTDVSTTTSTTYRASIRYSFQDRSGHWVQPQTLVENDIVDYEGRGQDDVPLRSKPLFDGVFTMSSQPWRKVLAMRIAGGNIAPGLNDDPDPERLVIVYGPFLQDIPEPQSIDGLAEPATPAAAAFERALAERALAHNRLLTATASGGLPAARVFVLDAGLEPAVIVRRNETISTDPYWPAAPTNQFRPDVNDVAGTLQITASDEPLADVYLGESLREGDVSADPNSISGTNFVADGVPDTTAGKILGALVKADVVSPEGTIDASKLPTLDLYSVLHALLVDGTVKPLQLQNIMRVLLSNTGAPILFGSINAHNGRIITVKGQPGAFVFDNGDQALLLQPEGPPKVPPSFSTLADGLWLSGPPLNPGSFVMVTYESSSKIYDILKGYKLIDARGFVNAAKMRHDLKTIEELLVGEGLITKAQKRLFERLVLNYPIVYEDAFVGGRIDLATSKAIFEALREYTLIDANGRLVLEQITGANVLDVLAKFLVKGTLTQTDITRVYRILVNTPLLLTLSYLNKDNPGPIVTGGRFTVTRLTTGAVPRLQRALLVGGIDGLLSLTSQNIPPVPILPFDWLKPVPTRIDYPDALDAAQVDFDGLYGRYFWELFFHGPMLVADALATNQRFLESLSWFRYVFDPAAPAEPLTDDVIVVQTRHNIELELAGQVLAELATHKVGIEKPEPIVDDKGWVSPQVTPDIDLSFLKTKPGLSDDEVVMIRNVVLNARLATHASRFWRFRPFRGHTLETLAEMLTDKEAIRTYDDQPFDPFAIARLRMGAFEKATVMQYIDTLLRWGDYYFTQDTWESITAASMLYVYASDLLGPRPEQVGICPVGPPKTFKQIRDAYKDKGGIPQFLIYLESAVPLVSDDGPPPTSIQHHAFNNLGTYFCVPENAQLVSYWDRVDDRLFKIRHSLDITGQFRALALFEPPLDPLALARAAGPSNDLAAPVSAKPGAVPALRYDVLIERARSLAGMVATLGAQILSAQERGDAEALALLETTQQEQVLRLSSDVAQQAIDEANATVDGLKATLDSATYRSKYYADLLAKDLNDSEDLSLRLMNAAMVASIGSSIFKTSASIAYGVPQVGSPFAMTYGGVQLGNIVDAIGGGFEILSEILSSQGQRALTMAGYERRREDWTLQKEQADQDVKSLTAQIDAAKARLASAKRQLEINAREAANVQAVDALLRAKFTNAQLYGWMVGRLAGLHFQAYLIALQAAKDAQTAFQFEFDSTQTFFDVDVWDPARKGLLAGESLGLGLERMAAAAVRSSSRPLEIERIVSLGQLNPIALDALKTTGACDFELPELMYDYDYPGHYQRQIKTISVSIPAVVGPYQSIKATLQQTWNAVALSDDLDDVKYLMGKLAQQPKSVRVGWGGKQQIAISRGVDDSGLFQLDFHDARYLPFEGTGAVSKWHLELPPQANRFDLDQLTDVILTVRYTAYLSETLKKDVPGLLATTPVEVGYYIDARRSMPIEWQSFMRDHNGSLQALDFEFEPKWAGALRKLQLDQVMIRLSASISWPAKVEELVHLKIGDEPVRKLDVQQGVAPVSGLNLDRDKFSGPWQVALDLGVIRGDPALHDLLEGDWLNPKVFHDVELMDVCEATIW
jgi:hypothetical protein